MHVLDYIIFMKETKKKLTSYMHIVCVVECRYVKFTLFALIVKISLSEHLTDKFIFLYNL